MKGEKGNKGGQGGNWCFQEERESGKKENQGWDRGRGRSCENGRGNLVGREYWEIEASAKRRGRGGEGLSKRRGGFRRQRTL